MDLPTLLVAALVAAVLIFAVVHQVRAKKRGAGGCGCGCAGCPSAGLCHPSADTPKSK